MADAGYFRVSVYNDDVASWMLYFELCAIFPWTLFTQGTSADQDNRFSDKEKKLLNSMKFDESLGKKVDMKKVEMKTFLLLVLGFLLYLRVLEIPKIFR